MNTEELTKHLLDEGCDSGSYVIGPRGAASDVHALTLVGDEWQIYYTERGMDQPPLLTFAREAEAEACEVFRKMVLSMRHDHCVGFFRSRARSAALMTQLALLGLEPREDHIPYGGWSDPRYRVFVTGKAIFAAREALGAIPVRDEEPLP